MLKKGLVQLYTGKGKGKTTAALGLALRAAGDNNKVLIYQFLKPQSLDLSERRAIETSGLDITFKSPDMKWDMIEAIENPAVKVKAAVIIKDAVKEITAIAAAKKYNVIILDELAYCLEQQMADIEDIKTLINSRDPGVEIVLTGRYSGKELIDMADLVSEISAVKHPFDKGIYARRGIEY